jgi:hypothetical protein
MRPQLPLWSAGESKSGIWCLNVLVGVVKDGMLFSLLSPIITHYAVDVNVLAMAVD